MVEAMHEGVHGFGVVGKSGARLILQVDFTLRRIELLDRGKEKYSTSFHNCGIPFDTGDLWFEIKLENKTVTLRAANIKEQRVIFNLISSAKGCQPFGLQDDILPLRCRLDSKESRHILNRGYLLKKGNALIEKWEKRFVCVQPGHFTYYKQHMRTPLHIVNISEDNCYVAKDGKSGFKVVIDHKRTYWFRLLSENSHDQSKIESERHDWIVSFESACRSTRATLWIMDPLFDCRDSISSIGTEPDNGMIGHEQQSFKNKRRDTHYSEISQFSRESDVSNDTESPVFVDMPNDPYLPKSGRCLSEPDTRHPNLWKTQTLPNKSSGTPPPLPQRGDSLTFISMEMKHGLPEKRVRGISWSDARRRLDSGPHDYPRGSSQKKKQDLGEENVYDDKGYDDRGTARWSHQYMNVIDTDYTEEDEEVRNSYLHPIPENIDVNQLNNFCTCRSHGSCGGIIESSYITENSERDKMPTEEEKRAKLRRWSLGRVKSEDFAREKFSNRATEVPKVIYTDSGSLYRTSDYGSAVSFSNHERASNTLDARGDADENVNLRQRIPRDNEKDISVHISAIDLTEPLPCQTKERATRITTRPPTRGRRGKQIADRETQDNYNKVQVEKTQCSAISEIVDSGNESELSTRNSSLKDSGNSNGSMIGIDPIECAQTVTVEHSTEADDITSYTTPTPPPRRTHESTVTAYV
ncbi:hypothetical protein ScPMuIL_001382 [Solemya velum]